MEGVELQVVSRMMHSYVFMPNLLFSPQDKQVTYLDTYEDM